MGILCQLGLYKAVKKTANQKCYSGIYTDEEITKKSKGMVNSKFKIVLIWSWGTGRVQPKEEALGTLSCSGTSNIL